MNSTLTFALAALTLVSPARADDFWVDPISGDDAHTGTGPATAWRTLRHAFSETAGKDLHTLHLLPGVHSDGSPLIFGHNLEILGEEGIDATIIQVQRLRFRRTDGPAAPWNLSQVTVRGAARGIDVLPPLIGSNIVFGMRDVLIEDCSVGLLANMPPGRRATVNSQRVTIQACVVGVRLIGDASLYFEDGSIRESIFVGILASELVGSTLFGTTLAVHRSHITGTAGSGIVVGGTNFMLTLADSLIEGNGGNGVQVLSGPVDIARSTLAGNTRMGLRMENATSSGTVTECVIAENQRDVLAVPGQLTASNSLVGDATLSGSNVIFGDPLFIDAATGDYRLRPSSPAVDQGAPSSRLDLSGLSRDIDGDLDRLAGQDWGALELRHLRALGPAIAGATLDLELLGPDPGSATIVLAAAPLTAAPAATPYGLLSLDQSIAWRALRVRLPGSGVSVQTSLDLPAPLAGATFGLQAWIPANSSPSGAAFSNAIEITVL